MRKLYLGVDPDKKGAVVCVENGCWVETFNMPVHKTKEFDVVRIHNYLAAMHTSNAQPLVILEKAMFSSPGRKGIASAHYSQGLFEGLLTATGTPYLVVAPQTWQKKLSITRKKGESKVNALLTAKRLFPALEWANFTPGAVDALLMAYYGYTLGADKRGT